MVRRADDRPEIRTYLLEPKRPRQRRARPHLPCQCRNSRRPDRSDPPRGNTVNRASIDNKPVEPEIVVTHLMEGIGIALDIPNNRMFVTDFAGSIYSARLDGSGERNFLFAQGNLTGIAYAVIPKEK